MWPRPTKWHQYQWPWWPRRSLLMSKSFLFPIFPGNIICINYYVFTSQKAHMTCNFSVSLKLKDFSRSQEVTYTVSVNVVMSRKPCKREARTAWVHTTNRKWYMANRIVTIQMTLSDIKWFTYCNPFQMGFFIHMCSNWQDFNWHSTSHGSAATAELLVKIIMEIK